jgi:hypothetical protein
VTESVVVALIALVGTLATAAATVAAAYARSLGKRIGTPNAGASSLSEAIELVMGRIENVRLVLADHVRSDEERFAGLERAIRER